MTDRFQIADNNTGIVRDLYAAVDKGKSSGDADWLKFLMRVRRLFIITSES